MAAGLRAPGFGVPPPRGNCFLNANCSALGIDGSDADFCRHLTEAARITAIPLSAFYEGPAPRGYIRLAFCKRPEVPDEA